MWTHIKLQINSIEEISKLTKQDILSLNGVDLSEKKSFIILTLGLDEIHYRETLEPW